jgi:prolyl-tRNA synthetase
VLYDDRDLRAGEKFADSDLLGMPYRVVLSKRSKEEGMYEVVARKNGDVKKVSEAELLGMFTPDEED